MDAIVAPLVEWPLEAVWSTPVGFVAFFTFIVGAVGLLSKTLSIPIYGAYLTFIFYASTTSIRVLEQVMFATLTLVIIGTAFKLWRLEGVGDI